MKDYIKINRKILDWEWWHDINTCRVFIFLILKANWKDSRWKGIEVKRGSYISSLDKMASDVDLTKSELRTAINHLQKTKEISIQTTRKYTVFTVLNYDLYQNDNTLINTQNDTKSTYKSHTINKLLALREEREEVKKENNNIMCKADANELFEQLWKLYPVKKGKGQVSDAKKLKLLEIGIDEMSRAIERYKLELEKDKDWRHPQNGSTFFNSGYVDYLDATYVPGKERSASQPKNQFNKMMSQEYDYDDLEKELLK